MAVALRLRMMIVDRGDHHVARSGRIDLAQGGSTSGQDQSAAMGRFSMLALIDTLRQIQGDSLGRLGLGPTECRYQIVATGARWRLRAYVDTSAGTPLLIVAAPIKRPYIWDLAASVSVVRHCLQNCLRLYLLEWMAPSRGDKGATNSSANVVGFVSPSMKKGSAGEPPFRGMLPQNYCLKAHYPT
jgi:hypothetical protein